MMKSGATRRGFTLISRATTSVLRSRTFSRQKPLTWQFIPQFMAVQYRHQSTQVKEIPLNGTRTETIQSNLLRKRASVRRTFGPNSNAQAMLVSGGEALAAHASFDPDFSRARKYIRNHAVGPAVLSPVLIQGLVGALIESSLPQSFFVKNSLKQVNPLIVGVEVEANFQVVSVMPTGMNADSDGAAGVSQTYRTHGYELELDTSVHRVSDGALVATGRQTVWLPDYVASLGE